MKTFAALGPGQTTIVDVPVPEPGDHEALVKTEGCVFCNTTDRTVAESHYGAPGFPVIIGHESFGRVVKTGKMMRNLQPGDRVTRVNAIPSGFNGTYYSAWGGFAEYGIVKDAPPVPGFGELALEKAGLLISLSETASCLMQLKSVKNKDILITGTGIASLSLVHFSKQAGARKVYCSGRRAERLEIAVKLGADRVFMESKNELTEADSAGVRVDYVLEASGQHDIFKNGVPLLREDGTLAIYGASEKTYEIDPRVKNVFFFNPKEEMAYSTVCSLLSRDGALSGMLMTHSWKFEEIQNAYEDVLCGKVLKGIVLMNP